jgi:protein involved in polysaccharide export with SLBB domain
VLTRVSILGAVSRPGFYYAAPDRPLSDLVMLAGGPNLNANLAELEVIRGQTKLLKPKDSRRLLKEGRTLEQIDVQSGDAVRIPEKRKINWQLITQAFVVLSTLIFTSIQLLSWYYSREDV